MTVYRRVLSREQMRMADRIGSSSARSVFIARIGPGDVWLDVVGRAGVRFTAAEWAELLMDGTALLDEILAEGMGTG